MALNRVVGGNPSEIFGTLTATGKIFLVNPNGILFGPNSYVDVAGLVASTLDISNEAFLNGNYTFNKYADKIGASVINQGYIQAKSVALMGQAVRNEGKIVTTLGKTTLASGEKATLSLDTAGMISVVIDEPVKEKVLKDGKEIKSGVENTGEISADGGVVVLTAKALDNVFDYAVNNEGIIEANALDTSNGKVVLKANQRVNVAGQINAEGGTVEVNAQGADISANIISEENNFNMNGGDTVLKGGIWNTSKAWIKDDKNIITRGDFTVNNGSLTFIADNDNDGIGNFTQDFGVIRTTSPTLGDIYIGGNNVTIRAIDSAKDLTIFAKNLLTFAPAWGYKEKIIVDHSYINKKLKNFPVLVKLDSSNFDFSKSASDGSDIRFVNNRGRVLSYEIEKWDSSNQIAYIWVKLPVVRKNSDTVFYMYHDSNPLLPADAYNDPTDVWSNGFVMVQHGNSPDGTNLYDSTSYNNNGIIHGVVEADGIIGDAGNFDGVDDYVLINDSPSLDFSSADGITIEAWINVDNWGHWKDIVFKGDGSGSNSDFQFALVNNGLAWDGTLGGTWRTKYFPTSQDTGTWIYVGLTHDNSTVNCYRDGVSISSQSDVGNIYHSNNPLAIGREGSQNYGYFDGLIDEVRISNTARSDAWIKASYNIENNPLGTIPSTTVTGLNAGGNLTLTGKPTDATGTPSIQAAIDAIGTVGGTSTINVAGGNYEEQVIINKDLSLIGSNGATILSPGSSTYTIPESTQYIYDPIIFAYGGNDDGSGNISGSDVINVNVSGFNIDGQNKAVGGRRFVGIFYRNVDGEISDNIIYGLEPQSGNPETFGILVYGDSDVTIQNNNVSTYTRGGIGVNGDIGSYPDPNAVIQNNTVTGNGLANGGGWAENGIQIGWGATGSIVGNTVTANGWPGTNWSGTGILVAGSSGVTVEGNEVYDNETGICVVGYEDWRDAPCSNVLIKNNQVYSNTYGISAQANVDHVTIEDNTIHDNEYYGIDVWAYNFVGWETSTPDNITIQNNKIYNHHPYCGIYLSGVNTNILIQQNDIYNNGGGIYLLNYSDATIHYNNIYNNTYGVWNYGSILVDAQYNYWGDATGPQHSNNPHGASASGDAVSDNVDFMPWYATPTTTPDTENVSVDHPTSSIIALSDTIQGGIDAAVAGDTIEVVNSRTYYENLLINKSLILTSSSAPVLDGSGTGTGINIGSDNVTVNGLTIQNYNVGINITGTFSNLNITNSYFNNNTTYHVQAPSGFDGEVLYNIYDNNGNSFDEAGVIINDNDEVIEAPAGSKVIFAHLQDALNNIDTNGDGIADGDLDLTYTCDPGSPLYLSSIFSGDICYSR